MNCAPTRTDRVRARFIAPPRPSSLARYLSPLEAIMATPREHVVSAARGDQPMDLVVRNVDLVNVFTAEIYKADLGIKGDRYAGVARYEDGKPAFEMQGFREID